MKRLALAASLLATAALAQTSGTTTAQPTMGPVVTTNADTKTVQVNFVAGEGGHNNGLNYNGDAKGEKTLTVPLGWTIEVRLSNAGRMPHDFAVVAGAAVPANTGQARLAFPDAATKVVLPTGAAEGAKFTANRPGTYLILCRVGRHAQNGMYVKMTVANGLRTASYQ
ncbi:sulfocyanin-like copper-binding protein [Deinococcus aestuarii]|uniref:sulfocyanin-like copper-binding protein n=1 Tax=Deinococcus aestuarii TaxID=2774531 RepID=UPI001C0DA123|nr:sulfocyanin-like copper-binding protein [Deinococcus aestuarii]